jgi:hypothetical protein
MTLLTGFIIALVVAVVLLFRRVAKLNDAAAMNYQRIRRCQTRLDKLECPARERRRGNPYDLADAVVFDREDTGQ